MTSADRSAVARPVGQVRHPGLPEETEQFLVGADEVREVTGLEAISLQPAAGSQGELTGLLLMRAQRLGQEGGAPDQ